MSNLIDRIFVIDDIISQANQKKIYDTMYGYNFLWNHIFDPTFPGKKSDKGTSFSSVWDSSNTSVDYPVLQAVLKRFNLSSVGTYQTRSFLHIANP